MFWLVVVVGLAAEDPSLPGALPPLDDDLLLGASSSVHAFGHGRVRVVAEDGFVTNPVVGAGLTGRVGATGALGDVRAAVVVGDGDWWVASPAGDAAIVEAASLRLVPRPLVPFLQRLTIEVPLAPLGAPGQLVVGRMPLVVGDGRLVGDESFDARGRSQDGVVLDTNLSVALVRTGVMALDLGVVDEAGAAPLRVLGFLETSFGFSSAFDDVDDVANADDVAVDVDDAVGTALANPAANLYLLVHHDAPTLRPTLGARASVDAWGLRLSTGFDGQLALDEEQGLSVIGSGVHGEAKVRTLLPWTFTSPRPFVEAAVEATGDVTAPAPSQHGTMGALDLVAFRNTTQVIGRAGVESADGFTASVTWRHIRPLGEAKDPRGLPLAFAGAFSEVDVDLGLAVAEDVDIDINWAGGIRDGAPAQRLLIGVRFSFGDDEGLLPNL